MNEDFQRLYRRLVSKEVDTSQFLRELGSIGDYRDDLFAALAEQYGRQDWRNLGSLMWAISLVPDRRFTPFLCDLLDHHRYDAYMEALADSLRR
jgi:hypothetical protein